MLYLFRLPPVLVNWHNISNGGWKETVLHTFVDHPGASPVGGGLIFDANGNLYGKTAGDGNFQTFGSVFEITP